MPKVKYFCLIIIIALFSSCIRFVSSPSGIVIDSQKARSFSDAFMDDVINDRRDTVYAKMEKEFQNIASREQFNKSLDNLNDQFGKLLKYEYDSDEFGAKLLYNGTTKPTRKIVYRATTTKGTYPITVTVVPNGNDLAVTDFLFVVETQ